MPSFPVIDPEEEPFDGLTLCPVCATPLDNIDQDQLSGCWSAECWPCNMIWNWDDEGYWEALKE